MPNFISDFFENRGWLGLVQKNSNGDLEVAGTTITGVASYTEAQIKDSGFEDATRRFITLEDGAVDATGGKPLLQVDPLRPGTNKVLQAKPTMHFTTVANALTFFSPLADWEGVWFTTDDVGNGEIVLVNTGTRIKPLNGIATIFKTANVGTTASPVITSGATGTTFNFTTLLGSPSFPAIFEVGDEFILSLKLLRAGATGTADVRVCLGTAGTSSDAQIYAVSMAATNGASIMGLADITISNATTLTTSKGAALNGSGVVGIIVDVTGNVNPDATMYLSAHCTSKDATTTVAILDMSLRWVTA